MTDRTLTCRDCGKEFVFTAGEQDFYGQRGFSEPQRCQECRAARKTQRGSGDSHGSGSGYSSGGYASGGGGYSSGGGNGDGYASAPRQLYPAVCSECGQPTEVPFNPTPGKPVFCRECFSARRTSSRYNSF